MQCFVNTNTHIQVLHTFVTCYKLIVAGNNISDVKLIFVQFVRKQGPSINDTVPLGGGSSMNDVTFFIATIAF